MESIEVIIPVFNGERFIAQAVQSVLNQSYPAGLIWVINDGSSDSTLQILTKLQEQNPQIQVISQENKGISAALNTALERVSSEWVAFLDSDDLWTEDRLKVQIEAKKEHPTAELFFGLMQEFEDFQEGIPRRFKAREEIYSGMHRSTLLCRSELFASIGKFDESLVVGEFIEWFVQIRNANREYRVIPAVLAKRRIHGSNMTASVDIKDYLAVIRRELLKKRKG